MLLEIILGTIGGLVFAIGMCMSLITEWDLLKVGIVVAMIGFMIPFASLLYIERIIRKSPMEK